MNDPQYSGMAHIGAQRRNERRKALTPKHQWVNRSQAPILSAAAQRVGRRADRCSRRDQLLIGPRFRPIRIGAARQPPIAAIRKTVLPADPPRGPTMPAGPPLHKLK